MRHALKNVGTYTKKEQEARKKLGTHTKKKEDARETEGTGALKIAGWRLNLGTPRRRFAPPFGTVGTVGTPSGICAAAVVAVKAGAASGSLPPFCMQL